MNDLRRCWKGSNPQIIKVPGDTRSPVPRRSGLQLNFAVHDRGPGAERRNASGLSGGGFFIFGGGADCRAIVRRPHSFSFS